ncbi:hypothetical protein CKO15_12970 [Halorhodospira abdelmalekii]|uniref:hypothetical protein n=1 Tax=Halorhodospira abdelmalekii TaxID=421629 RepID=UPI001905769A|nr:hypothetical protein [Halorhodospira abdelmalekii]MBK1736167.1 hypothetical protein [Halorhodospira abdelmalekii]
MKRFEGWLWGGGAAVALFAVIGFIALLGDRGAAPPVLPEPQGEACLLEAEQMRREHADWLSDRMHTAVRLGERDPARSLQACVDCHAVPAAQRAPEQPPMAFCRDCHTYTGVSIGCFQCHNERPKGDLAELGGVLP